MIRRYITCFGNRATP